MSGRRSPRAPSSTRTKRGGIASRNWRRNIALTEGDAPVALPQRSARRRSIAGCEDRTGACAEHILRPRLPRARKITALIDPRQANGVDEPILRLARAELAIGEGTHAIAKQLLDATDESGLSLSLRVRTQGLRARLLASSGNIDDALASLRTSIRQWTALSHGVRSPMLAERLERFGSSSMRSHDLLVTQRRLLERRGSRPWEREVDLCCFRCLAAVATTLFRANPRLLDQRSPPTSSLHLILLPDQLFTQPSLRCGDVSHR